MSSQETLARSFTVHSQEDSRMTLTKEQVHEVMMGIPESWRHYWCSGGPCGCMGGANCSGMATSKGVTHENWQAWVIDNPKPETPSIAEQLKAHFDRGGSFQ